VSEVAAEIGESPEQVLEAMEAAIAYSAVSIYAPRSGGEDEGDTYADAIGMIDERFELMEFQSAIGPTMRALPERDRLVLKLRFEEDLTQSEIAKRIGISQMHVSRLIRRSLERLRSVAEAQ
jgi:RNA polymerase sigma-B factor